MRAPWRRHQRPCVADLPRRLRLHLQHSTALLAVQFRQGAGTNKLGDGPAGRVGVSDRVIRDELLASDRWLSLKDNADRLAFVACLLTCDTLGNMEGSPHRLCRLWRDYSIGTHAHVEQTVLNLSDCDLIRVYEVDAKRYLHIPRFRQSRRYLGRLHPLSPWTTDQEKQAIAEYSHGAHRASAPSARSAHDVRTAGVGVGVGVGKGLDRGASQPKSTERARSPAKTLLPDDFSMSDAVREWAMAKGYERLAQRLEHFRAYARANGKKYVDWDAAFMNAIRGDWAQLGGPVALVDGRKKVAL
jgi:hypothetical protein